MLTGDATMTHQQASATAVPLFDASLFDIVGPIRLNYATSSITGTPRLTYQDAEQNLNFEDEEITHTQTPLGELVTVTLETVVDAFIRTFTLIVPTIKSPHGGETEFDTLGIETTDTSSAFTGPLGAAGVKQTHRVHQLHGNAAQVEF
jgi:hypothetical protein